MPSGIIVKGIGGFYYVKVENEIYECRAKGIFRKNDMTPLPGDRVSMSVIDESGKIGNIDGILPRTSQLVRPAVANIDQVAVVIAVKSPSPDLVLLDKILITSEYKELNAVVCINKIDLDASFGYKAVAGAYEAAGYKVIPLSSVTGEGFDSLKAVLQDKITVFAGQSGVGKSTLLNKIMDAWIMETGSVSEKIERGKHTTRHAELVELKAGGFIVDTPGFSSFELADISYGELELCYPEFRERLQQCRFTGCSHISEPGCSIKEALGEGRADAGRYERYIQFYNLLKQQKSYR